MVRKYLLQTVFLFFLSFICQATNYIVSNAGDYSINGLYKEQPFLVNGKHVYIQTSFYGKYIAYDGSKWVIGSGSYQYPYGNYWNTSSADTPPLTGWTYYGGTFGVPVLTIEPPTLMYSRDKFVEHYTNNGATKDTIQILYNKLEGDIFSGSNGDDFISNGKIQIAHVPAGMSAAILRRSDSTLLFYLKGMAFSHVNADDVINLTLRFKPEAFAGNDTVNMVGAYQTDLQVNFREAFTVGSSNSDYATLKEAEAGVTSFDILELAAETFTESINTFKLLVIIGKGADKTIVQAHEQKGVAAGRVFTFNYSPDTTYIKNITVRHGYLYGSRDASNGAGIECNTPLEMYSCQVSDNVYKILSNGSGTGAGIRANALKLYDCLISNNHLSNVDGYGQVWGGGLFCGNMLLVNTTVTGNYSSDVGAGIYGYDATLINCTVTNNTSNAGGAGMHVMGTNTSIMNSIISGNTAINQNCADLSRGSGTLNVSHSIISKAAVFKSAYSGSAYTPTGDVFNGTVESMIAGDPKLGILTDNGGATYTYALLEGSAAIDKSAAIPLTPYTDQRGYAAIGQRDVGAFEFGAVPSVTTAAVSGTASAGILIYPNPSKGVFHIAGGKGIVSVSNVIGNNIVVRTIVNEEVDLSGLQPGIYLLTFTTDEHKSTVVKVVLE
jgi:hypothetical protein